MIAIAPPLVAILLSPLLGALLAPLAERRWNRAPSVVAAVASTLALGVLLLQVPAILEGVTPLQQWSWLPAMGLDLALRCDGLSLLFALLILGMGLLVDLYARYYLPTEAPRGRFYALLLTFQAAMLGLVLSDNLLLLVLFWELTSLVSFLLIGFDPSTAGARRGARMALLVTGAGGLALLAGVLLLGSVVGSLSLTEVLAAGDQVRNHPLHLPILLLILLGAFTKSAQIPFHFWLLGAMSAPTPVSAYLHSATMVKAGVFLLARLFPVLADGGLWFALVGGVGLATFLFGAYVALFKHDMKGLLAYSTISHLGLMVFLIGLGTPLGVVAGLFHAINHAVFKASLFMAVGIIGHETGTRDMRRLSGLFVFLPITGTLAMVAAASMAGVPLLNGFLSKEMFFVETLDSPRIAGWPVLQWLMPAAAILGGAFSAAYSLRLIRDVFFNGRFDGQSLGLSKPPGEPRRLMRLPIEVLVAVCLLVGIFPEQVVRPVLSLGARGVLGFVPDYHLSLWQGWSPAFQMSLAALGGALLLHLLRRPLFAAHARWFPPARGARSFQRLSARLLGLAYRARQRIESLSLPTNLRWLVATAILLATLGWLMARPSDGVPIRWIAVTPMPLDGPSLAAAAILALSTLGVVLRRGDRLWALLLTGAVGLVVSLAFVHFSAPDLALTQVSVEIVTTLLLLLVLTLLPSSLDLRPPGWRQRRDLLLAVTGGIGSAVLAALMMLRPAKPISEGYLQAAEPLAGAGNVVNAILVDFRALDTLGEISVLAIAAVGIAAMTRGLTLRLPTRGDTAGSRARPEDSGEPDRDARHPLMLSAVARPVLPAALMLAAFLLLRGHEAPGGGFVAGLVVGAALILLQVANGFGWTAARFHPDYLRLIGVGLLLALLTGLGALLFDRPLLTSAMLHWTLPLLGELSLTSTLIFDVGVLLVVTGTLLLILESLGRLGNSGRDTLTIGTSREVG
ncbi:monovalent cation/H+ antiporter subunit A [Allochromatium palmeri]|uniref:Monovalent cation/H+ antiporter subunit A n=1 Tax=Allochromatium palmeri TaxID=231048 RepID=A0A6N8EAA7_9GAMM|nr:monovalent cation/H+ antiporter subunit A [Allochromatium palmeri]MTW21095.1 monovalent cation/H+ antiporter subunit A [Allochromatium palmeri]